MITITRLLVRPRNRNNKGISVRCSLEGSQDVNYSEIKDMIKQGHRFDADTQGYKGKYKDLMTNNESVVLLQIIKGIELVDIKIDQELTRRILLNGGLVEYTKKLESRTN